MPAIFLGQSPERDRNIDDICQQIRNCAKAGIFQVKYNFTILGIPRSGTVKGRGPSRYSEFVLANDKNKDTPTIAGKVDADTLLGADHLLPRARRSGRRGIQGEDGLPSAGSRRAEGLPRHRRGASLHRTGLKRFLSIKESPYHGLNFCQGTVSEQLEKPGEQIFDVIRYFGSRKKIFSVHFRNIEGGYLNFREIVHRQRQRRHAEGGARLQGSRLRRHADARPRAERGRRPGSHAGVRVRDRLHQGDHRGGQRRSVSSADDVVAVVSGFSRTRAKQAAHRSLLARVGPPFYVAAAPESRNQSERPANR